MRLERPPAHREVRRSIRAACDERVARHIGRGHGGDELGAVLGDALALDRLPDHEARHVGHEQQRDVALAGQLDEVRALDRRLGEDDAVVG